MKRGRSAAVVAVVDLPSDCLRLILDLLWQAVVHENGRTPFTYAATVDYFSFAQVNRQYNAVWHAAAADFSTLFQSQWATAMRRVSRTQVYHYAVKWHLREQIDALTRQHNVTYYSPVQRQKSEGRLAMKKLRRANYPSVAVKQAVLTLLAEYERIARLSQRLYREQIKSRHVYYKSSPFRAITKQ